MSDRRTVIFKAGYWYHEVIDNKTLIHIGGRTQKNESVHLIVDHFTPFVYVELPKRISWDKHKCKLFFDYLKVAMIDKKTMVNDGPLTYNPVQKYKLYHKKLSYFLYLSFPNEYSAKKLVTKMSWRSGFSVSGLGTFQADEFKVHEHNIDSIIKFTTLNMITLSGWIKAKEYIPGEDDDNELDKDYTSADISMRADWQDVNPVTLKTPVYVPPKYCSFDIECYSKNKNSKLPDPSIPENVCNQICMTFGVLGDASRKRILLTLGNPKNVENTDELRAHGYDEAALLLDFRDQILLYNPDIFMGYNTMKFDWGYLIKRADICGIFSEFSMLSRIFGKRADLKKMKWSSSAYGEQDFSYLECHGRTNVDLLIEVERNFRLPTYSLNAVSEFFQIGTKDDLSARDLFMLWDLTKDVLPLVVDKTISLSEFTKLKLKVMDIFPIRKCGNLVKEYRKRLLSCRRNDFCSIVREAMAIMGKYCVQDTVLVVDLAEKLNIWTTMEEMSNVTNIPISYLQTRGQQIRVLAQVYRETIRKNIIIPFTKKKNDHEKFQGAMVVEANAGEYVNVSTLDFASLYPSLIIAYNICYTTLLEPNDPTPDSECHVLIWEDHKYCVHDPLKRKGKKEDILCKSHHYRFRKIKYVIAEDGTVTRENEGLLPRLERNLLATRKVYKKDMAKAEAKVKMNSGKATEGDLAWFKKCGYDIIQPDGLSEKDAKLADVDFGVFNAKQLAVKISANSMYGSLGVQNGFIPLMAGAASVTAMGRRLITMAIAFIRKTYPYSKLVYGDSVSSDTPILCMLDGKIFYRTIDNLPTFNEYLTDGEKEYVVPVEGLKVWTEKGFTRINKLIRHKTSKKMFRVLTHTGLVDVTEDHSLLNENAEKVRPKNVKVGDKLLHSDLPLVGGNISNPIAYAMGLFYGDGSCGYYNCPSGKKYSWAINNTNLDFLRKAKKCLNDCYKGTNSFKILDTMKSSHVYKLVAQGDVKAIVKEWRRLFYDKEKFKKVPDEVFEYNEVSRRSFFDGYYAADGDKDEKGYLRFDNKGKIGSAGLYLLANSLGYPVSINLRSDKDNIYRMTLTRSGKKQRLHPDKIKKIVDLPRCDGYVYDLETENHHFSAGIGRMIVHNTDSCMIHFENKTIQECFALAEEASDRATHHLKCFITGVSDDYTVGPDKKPIVDVKSTDPYFKSLTYEEKCHVLDYESSPIDLEFENMYGWFLLLTKKRYMAEKVNKKGEVTGETLKGNVLTRRDNSKYLKDTYRELKDKNKKEDDCIIALCDRINMLFTRQIPDLHLIIYMGIKSLIDYAKSIEIKGERQTQKVFIDKNKDPIDEPMGPTDPRLVFSNIPQVLLALKMSRRGEIIPPNTRLEFLYLCNEEATHQGEKAEDFTYYKENKDIENLRPDYLHYIEKQLAKPVTELLNVRFPKPIIPYIDPELQLRKYIDMFTDLQRYRVANLKVYTKPRPEPNKNELVGWRVLRKEGYKPRLKSLKLGDDLEFTEYKFKNNDARIAYIMDQIKNGKSANDISEKSYPGLLSFCQKWKSVNVIDKKYKENGLTRRRWRKPTYVGPKIRVGSNVVLLVDHGGIKKDTICKILNREDIGKGKSMTYIYDLCCEKTEIIEKNVPRVSFTTFVTKGDTMMKNILEYRVNYREVVDQLDDIFKGSSLNFHEE